MMIITGNSDGILSVIPEFWYSEISGIPVLCGIKDVLLEVAGSIQHCGVAGFNPRAFREVTEAGRINRLTLIDVKDKSYRACDNRAE